VIGGGGVGLLWVGLLSFWCCLLYGVGDGGLVLDVGGVVVLAPFLRLLLRLSVGWAEQRGVHCPVSRSGWASQCVSDVAVQWRCLVVGFGFGMDAGSWLSSSSAALPLPVLGVLGVRSVLCGPRWPRWDSG